MDLKIEGTNYEKKYLYLKKKKKQKTAAGGYLGNLNNTTLMK